MIRSDQYLQPILTFASKATIAPLTKITLSRGSRGSFDGGAYDESLNPLPSGLHIKDAYDNVPTQLDSRPSITVDRPHVYGGLLQNEHFGHFCTESLSRLWALKENGIPIRDIVFYPRHNDLPVSPFVHDIIKIMFPSANLIIARDLITFSELIIPSQLVHAQNCVIYGHEFVRSIMAPLRRYDASAPRRVYVSRSRLPAHYGGILGEKVIEQNLRDQGYHILYPERSSITEQLRLYSSADEIIFADGSAIHLFAFVCRPDQRVFVIWRRKPTWTFEWQVQTFGGSRFLGKPCVIAHYIPLSDGDLTVHAKAKLDYCQLKNNLIQEGFVTRSDWTIPSESDLELDLGSISKFRYVPTG